jgi:hypothetical protein
MNQLERRLRELEHRAPALDFTHLDDAELLEQIAAELAALDPERGEAIRRGAARVNAGEAVLTVGWAADPEDEPAMYAAALVEVSHGIIT